MWKSVVLKVSHAAACVEPWSSAYRSQQSTSVTACRETRRGKDDEFAIRLEVHGTRVIFASSRGPCSRSTLNLIDQIGRTNPDDSQIHTEIAMLPALCFILA